METYFAAATQAALVLAEFRAPFRGRSAPVNAWSGTFDLAVNFFSGSLGELGRKIGTTLVPRALTADARVESKSRVAGVYEG